MTDRPRTLERPYLKLILDADPQFYTDRRKQLEYQFTRRDFYADQDARGAYGLEWDFSDEFSAEYFTFESAALLANGFD